VRGVLPQIREPHMLSAAHLKAAEAHELAAKAHRLAAVYAERGERAIKYSHAAHMRSEAALARAEFVLQQPIARKSGANRFAAGK